MKRGIIGNIGFVAVCSIIFARAAWSEGLPQAISKEEQQILSLQFQNMLPREPISELVVEAELPLPGPVIFVRRLIFGSSGSIVIEGPSQGRDLPVLIVAKEIAIAEDAVGPQVRVLWPRLSEPNAAMAGQPGRDAVDGQPGGAGAQGQPGVSGTDGQSTPNVVLFTESINGRLTLNLEGQDGGKGGPGGRGGDGGAGGAGNPASQSMFDCRRGPGAGGNGGVGGPGGNGGSGGRGGDGGSLIAIVPNPVLVKEHVSVRAKPGSGGAPGEPGEPGLGGPGGRVGEEALPWCRQTASNGSIGPNGTIGTEGPFGELGSSGSITIFDPLEFGYGVSW